MSEGGGLKGKNLPIQYTLVYWISNKCVLIKLILSFPFHSSGTLNF